MENMNTKTAADTKTFCPDCQLAAGQAPEPGSEVVWCPLHKAVETLEYHFGEHKELPNFRGEGRKGRRKAAAGANKEVK